MSPLRLAAALGLALAPLLLAGCAADRTAETTERTTQEQPVGEAAALSPAELAAIGAELRAEPARADEILAARGLEWEAYEAAVRSVAADVEAAREYEQALLAAEAPASGQ